MNEPLIDPYHDGVGGNGYSYEVEGHERLPHNEVSGLISQRCTEVVGRGNREVVKPMLPSNPTHTLETEVGTTEVEMRNVNAPWSPLKRRRTLQPRAHAPGWIDKLKEDEVELLTAEWGVAPAWGWTQPWLWSTLRSDRSLLRPPAVPTLSRADTLASHSAALPYWTPLTHLLLFGFGWSRPDLGLARWFEAGLPDQSLPFRLVKDVWVRDGQIEAYLAWLVHIQTQQPDWTRVGGPRDDSSRSDLEPWLAGWARQLRKRAQTDDSLPHWICSQDGLHMTGHGAMPGFETALSGSMILRPGEPHATLVLETAEQWHWNLRNHATTLPHQGAGWTVSVVTHGLGLLGEFTCSPATGIWHLADLMVHDWHQAGQ